MTSLAPRFARYQALTLVQHGPILEIVMGAAQSANRKLSTADAGLHRELAEIWRDVSAEPSVRVALIRGEGKGFSAGGDLHLVEQMADDFEVRTRVWHEARDLVYNVINCDKPIVSAMHGPAVGAGLVAGLLADISIAARDARIVDGHTRLGVAAGDTVTLIAPSGQVTPAGVVPRMKQMQVAGVFDSGHYEYDANMAMLHYQDAQKVFRLEGPTGVRLKLQDLHQAPRVAKELASQLQEFLYLRDWTQQNKTWFAAVQVEKRMMFIILTLIVAVAAFNLVSTLVMTVQDKRSDIAILRTLGASPASIMGIFVVQGAMVGVLGTLGGLALGLLVACNIDVIVPAIEQALGASFLPKDIYLISRMPSEPLASDIVPIALIALLLAFVATLYPSWRASRVNPAEALRYE